MSETINEQLVINISSWMRNARTEECCIPYNYNMRIVVYTIVRNVPLKMSSSFFARTVTKDALSPEPDS